MVVAPLCFLKKICVWQHISFRNPMVRDAFLYRKPRARACPFVRWSTCSQINFYAEMNDSVRFSVRTQRVRARRTPCINDTNRSNICHLEHVRCIKTCTTIGRFDEFASEASTSAQATRMDLIMSASRVVCKTQWFVIIEHQHAARFDVQVKLL